MKNKTLEQNDWDKFYSDLGHRFKISHRVIRHVRNCYQVKYKDKTYEEAIVLIRRDASRKLTAIKQSGLPEIQEAVYYLIRPIDGLEKSTVSVQRLKSKMKLVLGFIDKTGFNESIIRFSKRVTEEDMKIIVTSMPE